MNGGRGGFCRRSKRAAPFRSRFAFQGHNRIITYSRPVYFCALCGLILLLDAGAEAGRAATHTVYGLPLFSPESLRSARDLVMGESIWGRGSPWGRERASPVPSEPLTACGAARPAFPPGSPAFRRLPGPDVDLRRGVWTRPEVPGAGCQWDAPGWGWG